MMETSEIVHSIKAALDVVKEKVEDDYPELEEKERVDIRVSITNILNQLLELLETINNVDMNALAAM